MNKKLYMPPAPTGLECHVYSTLQIDTSAIVNNYKLLSERVKPAVCSGVVKADCYGLGVHEIAPELAKAGCKHFFTAYLDEAMELRKIIPSDCIIYVLYNCFEGCEKYFSEHNLIPVLTDIGQIERWQRHAKATSKKLLTALHFDTGMTRCAIPHDELSMLASESHRLNGLQVSMVMSHLACADDPDNPYNEMQRKTFEELRRLLPSAPASFANSGGIFLGKDYHFNMVRPGRALYGISPIPAPNPMNKAIHTWGRICQVQAAEKGQTVGYGRTFKVKKPMRIATIAAGYADGYAWSLNNKGYVGIAGYQAPVIGRISMDLVTIDVTHIPETEVSAGDWALLIGEQPDTDEMARNAGTLPHELLLRLGKRLKRVYTK